MVKLPKNIKTINTYELLGLDPNNSDDRAYVEFGDLMAAFDIIMLQKKISMSELARRLKISRQAVYDKFTGRNLTIGWIKKACKAIGVTLIFKFIESKKAA